MFNCFSSLAPLIPHMRSRIHFSSQHYYLCVMVYITRKEHFNAAHRLFREDWTDVKNEEIFGKCANKNWHGHNFDIFVTVKGNPDPETGFVVDFKKLGKILKTEIVDKVDHKNLNLDVDFLSGIMPTCENVVIEFWKILEREISTLNPQAQLHCIKLIETPGNYVEYYGPNQ